MLMVFSLGCMYYVCMYVYVFMCYEIAMCGNYPRDGRKI